MQPEQPIDRANKRQQPDPITREVFDQILNNTEALRSGDPSKYRTFRTAKDVAMIAIMRDAYLTSREAADIRWNQLQSQPDGSALLTFRSPHQDHTASVSPETMQLINHACRIESTTRKFTGNIRIFHRDRKYLNGRIRAVAKTAGLKDCYTGDSPRHGMMIDMLVAGFDSSTIAVAARLESHEQIPFMLSGRWSSPSSPVTLDYDSFSEQRSSAVHTFNGR